ncbi:MAG TPA: tetratricopeptide repeat protein [Planctomycetota bacterium]|nr:tetratricopeptide repeat protein [Planctomycetota bacterium]
MKAWLARAAREWPWGIAICALVSLLFIPRVVSFGGFASDAQRLELDALGRELESGDATAAESRLVSFLSNHPRSPLRVEANLLLARATLARGRGGLFPGAKELARAWSILMKAPHTPEYADLRREAASQMDEYGLTRDAVDRFGQIYSETHDPGVALDLARALVRRAAAEPELRSRILDDASARVSEALHVLPADQRLPALRVKALVLREGGRYDYLLAQLSDELAETRLPADRGLLQLERGRTFAKLGRNMEALASFDEAERLISSPLLRGMAQVDQAQLFLRAGNPEGAELCKRLQASESPATPFALLVLGASQLNAQPAAGLETLLRGYSQIRRPRALEDAGFDSAWVESSLRTAVEREHDPDRLQKAAAVYGELARLQPNSRRIGFADAAVLLRARRFEEAADRFLATGRSARAESEDRERAALSAADACAEGGLYHRAASLYRDYYELRPAANLAGLFHRAASLKKAGDRKAATSGFEEYVSKAGPSGSFTGTALLELASMDEASASWDAALATYDRVLQAREVLTSPERDDWAQALLGRGRTLLQLSRPAQARAVLEEYLERYADGAAPAPASVEAAWLLVRAAIDERQWKTGLDRVRSLDTIASRLPESDRASVQDRLREARFVEGDLLFQVGDYAAAIRAYGEAAGKTAASDDRLWGLIGRARSLARLERIEEARREYRSARALFDQGPGPSTAGRAREYWDVALQELAREVR